MNVTRHGGTAAPGDARPASGARRADPRVPAAHLMQVVLGAALALAVLLFLPWALDPFEAQKVAVVRVCGLTALSWTLAVGLRFRPPWRLLDLAVLTWLVIEAASAGASVSPWTSIWGTPIQQKEGLVTSLALTGLYAAARIGNTGKLTNRWLDIFLASAMLAALYGLVQAAGLDPIRWVGAPEYGTYRRPHGPLGHPNLLGVVTASACAAAFVRALVGPERRTVNALLAALLATATALTLSRAAWFAAVAGMVTGAVLTKPTVCGGKAWRLGTVVVAVVLVIPIFLAFSPGGAALRQRLAELLSAGSTAGRVEIWRGAIAAWWARPWLGHGPDTFELVFPRFQPPKFWLIDWELRPFHAHSIYLHTLATRGVLGLLSASVWCVALAHAFRKAMRSDPEASRALAPLVAILVALAVAGAFGALGISGAVAAVTISGLVAGADRGAASPAGPTVRVGAAPFVLAVIAAVLAAAWGAHDLAASRAALVAKEHLADEPELAILSARCAATLAPHEVLYACQLEWTLETVAIGSPQRATLLREAEAAARHAVALAPGSALAYQSLGSALAGQTIHRDSIGGRAAEAAFAHALELAPADGVTWVEMARLELYLGRPGAALAPARRALRLYPQYGRARAMLARALLGIGDAEAARVELEQALLDDWHGSDDDRRAAQALLERLRSPAS